jgi:hypothetical protein
MARRVRVGAGVAVVSILGSACGQAASTVPTTTSSVAPSTTSAVSGANTGLPSSSSTPTTTPATTTTAVSSLVADSGGDFTADYGGGYTSSGNISLYAIQRASTFSLNEQIFTAGCGFNSATDALVPFTVTLQNTTSGFPITVSGEVVAGYTDSVSYTGVYTMVPIMYSDGSWQCGQGQGGSLYFGTLPAGSKVINIGYLWYQNYYSPTTPRGAVDTLKKTDIQFNLVTESLSQTSPTTIEPVSPSNCSDSDDSNPSMIMGYSPVLSCPV